jgi:hypothetical protein
LFLIFLGIALVFLFPTKLVSPKSELPNSSYCVVSYRFSLVSSTGVASGSTAAQHMCTHEMEPRPRYCRSSPRSGSTWPGTARDTAHVCYQFCVQAVTRSVFNPGLPLRHPVLELVVVPAVVPLKCFSFGNVSAIVLGPVPLEVPPGTPNSRNIFSLAFRGPPVG